MTVMNAIQPPTISIGLPVFNGEPYIGQAIESLLTQSYQDFELIICDNASTDGTFAVCDYFARQDQRIRLFQNPQNLGAAYNYNRVFELSNAPFFKWAAADDYIDAHFLSACLPPLQADPEAVLCYANTVIVDDNGKTISTYDDQFEIFGSTPSKRYAMFNLRFQKRDKCNAIFGVIRSSALRQTRLIDRFVSSDIVLLAELALLGKFIEVGQSLFFRRDHAGSSMRAYSLAQRSSWFDPQLQNHQAPAVNWRIVRELARSIQRLPITIDQKVSCYPSLAGWMWYRRRLLWSELRRKTLRRLKNAYQGGHPT